MGRGILIALVCTVAWGQTTDERVAVQERQLRAAPKNTRLRLELAITYLQKLRENGDSGYLDRASKLVEGVLEEDSGNAQALRLRNEVDLHLHEFRRVAEAAQDLTKLAPNDAGNWATFGDALMELGRYGEAGEAYQKMLALRPGLESYNRAAYFQFVTGHPDDAIRLMKLAIQSGSSSTQAVAFCYSELGDMQFKTGKLAEAEASYRSAVKLFPSLHKAHAGLGRLYASRGKTTQAIESYQRAHASVPLVEYAAALEDLYRAKGNAIEAAKFQKLIEVLDQIATARGEKANRVLALIYVGENRKLDRAVKLAEAELENRGDVYTYDALSWIYHKTGRPKDARAASKKAIAYDTPEPEFYYHAAVIAEAEGEPEEARLLLKRATALNAAFEATLQAAAK